VAVARSSGSPHTAKPRKSTVTVPARGNVDVEVELTVPAATAGDSSAFHDVAGLVTFTPVSSGQNGGVALRVPYYLVPQAVSNIATNIDVRALQRNGSATATVTNQNGATTGAADWYAWGLADSQDDGLASNDLRAVGAQSVPGFVAFGISTHRRWSNASTNEFDVFVDVNTDGVDDYLVVGIDLGLVTTGDVNGELATAVLDLRTGSGEVQFFADAPRDSSTLVLPVRISQLCATGSPCLSETNPRLRYHAQSFGLTDGTSDTIDGVAAFNAFTPAISTGFFDVVPPKGRTTETVTVNPAEWAQTPAKGLLIMSHDNRSGRGEAQLIPVTVG
jgi:hypothetical protein